MNERPFLMMLSGYRGNYKPRSPVMLDELIRIEQNKRRTEVDRGGANVRKARVVVPWPAIATASEAVVVTVADPENDTATLEKEPAWPA